MSHDEAVTKPDDKAGSLTGVLVITSALALTIAIATWFLMSRRVDQLQQEVTSLQDAHRELALQVTQGRKPGSGPVGQVIDVAGAPALGPQSAAVTLIEFSDYE